MAGRPLIVGIGGTLRPGSTSERALALTLSRAQALGAETRIFAGLALNMPLYDTAVAGRTAESRELVEAIRLADGIVISSPGYHGSISGLLKNALDYVEDLRSDTRPYFTDRAVGLIACADGAQAMGSTLATLRSIIHALRGWPTPYAAMVNATPRPFGPDGTTKNATVSGNLAMVADQVMWFARRAFAGASEPGPDVALAS